MKIKTLILAAITATTLQVHAADIKASDSIAAVVDNEVITLKRFNSAVAQAKQQLPKGSKMNEAELRRMVLSQLVNQSLLVQAGKRRNINASESEIDEAIAQQAASRKISIEKFYAQAAKNGISKSALRQEISDGIINQKVRQQAIMQQARVSDAELDAAMQHAQEQGVEIPLGEPVRQYRAQHILIKADKALAEAAAEASIRKIWKEALSGKDFEALARQYSQDSSAAQGGDLGWFSDGIMVPQFENTIHQLKKGEISKPFKTQFGWHIAKLIDTREAATDEDRRRNALRQYLEQQRAAQVGQSLLQELHENAYIDVRIQ